MGVKQRITIALIITFTAEFMPARCQKGVLTREAVATILQDILSPCSADKGLQLIKMAATRPNRQMIVPEMAMPVRAVVPNEIAMPPQAIITSANDIGVPRRAIIANGNELPMPARAIMPNTQIMQQLPIQPMQQVIQPRAVEPLLLPKEIYQTVPVGYGVPQAREIYQYPAPAPVVNPYLPAASPVSALAPPFTNMLPPASPQSRGQFLRKIPIPPPSL